MSLLGIILVIVVIALLIGAWPSFGLHSYGPYPSGILGVVLLIIIILVLVRVL